MRTARTRRWSSFVSGKSKLGEHAAHVLLDRALGHPQPMGDAGVRAALGRQREDLPLTLAEPVERVVAGDECRTTSCTRGRVDHRAAFEQAVLERVDEVFYVGDAGLLSR